MLTKMVVDYQEAAAVATVDFLWHYRAHTHTHTHPHMHAHTHTRIWIYLHIDDYNMASLNHMFTLDIHT